MFSFGLCLAASPAHAQWVAYQSTNTLSITPAGQGYAGPSPSPASGGVVTTGATGTTGASGSATLSFQWTGSAGQTVTPLCVLVTATASMIGGPPLSGYSALDGLGDAQVVTHSPGVTQVSSSGQELIQKSAPAGAGPGTILSLDPITLNASATSGASSVTVSLSGKVDTRGATLTLPGTTLDSSTGNLNILVGQQCSGTLAVSGFPANSTISNLMWSASGNTVQKGSWTPGPTKNSATFLGLVNPYTYSQATQQAAPPVWYWDDSATTQTVTCTATVTPPAGQGSPSRIAVGQSVTLDSPKFTNKEPVGVVVLNYYYYLFDGSPGHPLALVLAAGGGGSSAPIAEQANGITFNDTVLTPAMYGATGTWYHLQLVSVSRYETPTGSTTAIGAQGNTVPGALDYGKGPNGITLAYDQTLPADGTDVDPDDDNPALGISDLYQEYNVRNERFQTYIMYTPPTPPVGNSIAVPLAYFTWQWNVDVTEPATPLPKSWAYWNDRATTGTITGPPANSASRQLAYPTWTSLRNLAWATH